VSDLESAPPLRAIAASRTLLYGCAVSSADLDRDAEFAGAVNREVSIIVPEWELKRGMVQREPGRFDFSGGEKLLAFAARNAMRMRGHTLVWHFGNPPWLEQALRDNPRPALLTDCIAASCTHFKGRIHSWDVVNEVVAPEQGHELGLRVQSPWYQAFGEIYIADAFIAARQSDPDALLFYGEYNVEGASRRDQARRTAVLKLLERLKRQGVPIDGFGVQGHLHAYKQALDAGAFAAFLKEIAAMGLKIMITELDVADRGGAADPGQRDVDVAEQTRVLLAVALANPATIGVLTWGLSDRYSWLSRYPDYRWPDGQLSRGLPLDGALKRKPMWGAIAQAFGGTA
jgi:endo-1,4-beta-xylanase